MIYIQEKKKKKREKNIITSCKKNDLFNIKNVKDNNAFSLLKLKSTIKYIDMHY